ncbi:MAG: PBP1A family penicillin-binding protein [Acidobacteria bacterium]|nr:PBP1A family penicillin-binding protein [Acidobacteriota bacterium]
MTHVSEAGPPSPSSRLLLFAQGIHLKKLFGWSIYSFLVLLSIVLGTFAGLYLGYRLDVPQVRALEDYRPDVVTQVFAKDGTKIGEFFIERRILVHYDQIPLRFKQAIVAAEDETFWTHTGVDLSGILRASYRNLKAWSLAEGGSTITQQLSKLLFLYPPEKTFERKFKEALLAFQIEKYYTKEQILTLYANQIYMGHWVYGIAAAAEFYFDKPLERLTLEECALLAAIPKSPKRYSPLLNPENARSRRNWVLQRMAEEGYITRQEARQAQSVPVRPRSPERRNTLAPYFLEWVRRDLENRYETEEIWRKGLQVWTTLDARLQESARRALAEGLLAYDKRRGWRGVSEKVADPEHYSHEDWRWPVTEGQRVTGVVLQADASRALVRIGHLRGELDSQGMAWTGRRRPSDILRRGDLAWFRVAQLDLSKGVLRVLLDQKPEVEGALVAVENTSGEIKAMVGGFDFDRSKFNRATQARRQTGSAFKPFIYVTALENGLKESDTVLDAPLHFRDRPGRVWSPTNYDGKYKGLVTVRTAVAESRNIPAVRLASRLGIDKVVNTARRFGISGPLQPYLSTALGASEATLLEMTSAYSAFPNKGIRVKPHFIQGVEDYMGIPREEGRVEVEEVTSPEVADAMVRLLRGVVEFGTATRAQSLHQFVAGKTGTTDDFTDAWFIGFTPSLTAGVWVGFDIKKSLGDQETAARVALPIWISFMSQLEQMETQMAHQTKQEVGRVKDRKAGRMEEWKVGRMGR